DAHPQVAVAEAVGGLGRAQVAAQLVDGAVADQRDVRPGGTGRAVLGQGPQRAGLPGLADGRRERVALPLGLLQDVGVLRLEDEQTLVLDTGVGDDGLVAGGLAALLDLLLFLDRVAHGPDEALTARQPRLHAVSRELLLGLLEQAEDVAPARALAALA